MTAEQYKLRMDMMVHALRTAYQCTLILADDGELDHMTQGVEKGMGFASLWNNDDGVNRLEQQRRVLAWAKQTRDTFRWIATSAPAELVLEQHQDLH